MLRTALGFSIILLAACSRSPVARQVAEPAGLAAAEIAFARSMADRNLEAFSSFIDTGAVFINNGKPLRGRGEIIGHWKQYFSEPQAPFSWYPEISEVSTSTGLGYSSGPVRDPSGKVVAIFASTWRLNRLGEWKIVFDNGHAICACNSKS